MADPLTYADIFNQEEGTTQGLTYGEIFGEDTPLLDQQPSNLNLFDETTTTTAPKTTEGLTFSDLGIQEGAPTINRGDPNSRTNLFFKAFDRNNLDLYEGLKLVGDQLEEKYPQAGEYLKFFSDKGIEKNKQDLAKRPDTLPPRLPFGDDGYIDEFKQDFTAGNYKPAF